MESFSREWLKNRPMEFIYDYENNGFIAGEKHIPEEILIFILSHVDSKSLLNCRLVCQNWKRIVETEILRLQLGKEVYRKLKNLLNGSSLFLVLYKIVKSKPFNRNLIKNSCGEDNFEHWRIVRNGGGGWKVEAEPQGSDPLPFNKDFPSTCCFVTSWSYISKLQSIDLLAGGVPPIILDELQPTIYVSEMMAGRYDCSCKYSLEVKLYDSDKEVVDECVESREIKQWEGREWHKVEHVFENYGKGIRTIEFKHSGTDLQFWRGHYGCKMSRACVKIIF